VKIYVISLKTQHDRRNFQEKQFKNLGLNFIFSNATSTKEITSQFFEKHSKSWQRPLKITEVACYLSHRKLWQKISVANEPSIIMEDDVLISKNFLDLVDAIKNKANCEYINLENRGRKKFVSKTRIKIFKEYSLFRLYQDRTGAAGYVLWPSGAQKLLRLEKKYGFALADAHITRCYSLNGFQMEPSPVIQSDMCAFYNLELDCDKYFTSTVSSHYRPKGGIFFLLKKIKNQINLGIRILFLKLICEKRYIALNKSNFK